MTTVELSAPPLDAILDDPDAAAAKAVTRGTHRSRTLEETVALARGCLDLAGVSRVADVTGLDYVGIPVVNTVRPCADRGNLTVTCGKGFSTTAALASALMEAIERHCGEQHGRVGVLGSLNGLRDRWHVLHPRKLILRRGCGWTPDTELEWWPARELSTGAQVLVPAAAVFTPYHGTPRLIASLSDGLAAGNCRAEAVLHGLYELVERDCTAFGEVLGTGRRIRLATLPEPARGLCERLRAVAIEPYLYAFTSEVGVPTFYAMLDDTASYDGLLINGGAGCHLDPAVAACRALTEAVQSRLSVISGGREDLHRHSPVRDGGYPAMRARLDSWVALPEDTDLTEYPNLSTSSIGDDLRVVLARLAGAGFEHVFVADVTLPGLPFAVCRSIVPGFEFFNQEQDRLGRRLLRALLAHGKVER